MDKITRGTTPRIIVELPQGFETTDVAELWVTVSQRGELFTKTLEEMTPSVDGKSFEIELTQRETLILSCCRGTVQAQARLRDITGAAIASDIVNVPVADILKGGEI